MSKPSTTTKFDEAIDRNIKIAATLWWNISGMSLLSASINHWAYQQKQAKAHRDFMKK